jgi:hypothetical protein
MIITSHKGMQASEPVFVHIASHDQSLFMKRIPSHFSGFASDEGNKKRCEPLTLYL